jgi:AraC-like DNA-binding protein
MRGMQRSSCDLFRPISCAWLRHIAARNGTQSKFCVFNSQINAIEIERRDLYAIKRGIDRHVYALLATYAEYLLARAPGSGNIRDAVESAVRDGLAQGRHDFDFVVQRLGMSARTLQRRIAASESSFSLVRDEIRFELAASMLAHSELSIGEIGYRLGYSEIASFTRAFTRRFGKSPRSVRAPNMRAT